MSYLKQELLRLVACSGCGGHLEYTESIRCVACGRKYELVNGAIAFLPSADGHPTHARPDPLTVRFKNAVKRFPRLYAVLTRVFGVSCAGLSSQAFLKRYGKSSKVVVTAGAGPRLTEGEDIRVDLFAFQGVDLLADVSKLPFKSNVADAVICESVLEHVEDVNAAVGEMSRILKPGGMCYFTIPFIFPYHSSPCDYLRLTEEGFRSLGAKHGFACVEVGVRHGPTSALILVFAHWVGLLFSFGLRALHEIIFIGISSVLAPLGHLLDLYAGRLPNAHVIASGHYFVGRKLQST